MRKHGLGMPLLLLVTLVLGACGSVANAQTPPSGAGGITATVQRGDIETSVSASGTVTAMADANLSIQGGGVIKEFFIKPGDRVKAGQKLVSLDDRDLRLQLTQAEANLASAQAKYEQAKAGATDKELAQAEAAVRSAQAKYQQTAKGTTTAQDISNAEAAVRSAQARLEAARTGSVTPQDIASAEAQVRSAEAKLTELMAGPKPEDIDSAVQKLNQARENRDKVASQLANSKEQSRIAVEQAADDIRTAQAAYGAAKLVYDEAVRTGRDPNTPTCPATNRKCNELTDIKLRQYKADLENRQIALNKAEQSLEGRRLAYEDAKQQEIIGLRVAESQILEATNQVDKARVGPSPEQIIQSQAAVDQARSNLDKLRQPVKATEITQAQATLDQARAQLEKLRRGPTSEELAQVQASVDQAEATYNELKAGAKPLDLTVALASVKQSEAARDLQRSKVDQATLLAPFDGVIAAINGTPGTAAPTAATTPLVSLVDDSQLRIDIRVAESDMARLKLSQEAKVSFDALPDRIQTGRVAFIAPKATTEQNVVAYLVTVLLPGSLETSLRPGMTANVSIVTERKTNVLVAPSRAIRTIGRERVIEVRYKGLTFPVAVQTGMTGDSVTEIVSGLREGDTVVINTQPTNRIQPNVGGPGAARKPGG